MHTPKAKRIRKKLLEIQNKSPSQPTNYEADPHIFNSKWEYILSAVAMTVGFGSVWRFPYLIYKNGGGAFLIPYLISLLILGVPMLYLQTAIGQMHRTSLPFTLMKIHPALKMLGIAVMTASMHISIMYNVLLTYSYRFLLSSFETPLPFAHQTISDRGYFQEVVLQATDSIAQFGGIVPELFFIFTISLLLCHFIITKGIKTSGKIISYMSILPFILILILLLRGLFLPGAAEGIKYLFSPQWDSLLTGQIWADSMIQAFFQCALGAACVVNFASMKPRREDFRTSVLVVPAGICLVGITSAMTVFIYLSHFCYEAGLRISDPDLSLSGPSLVFNVLPKALTILPLPNLCVLIFFLAMVMLGIGSQLGLMEGLYCYLKDEFKSVPKKLWGLKLTFQHSKYILLVILMIPSVTLTSRAGIYYLQFYDYFFTNIPMGMWIIVELYVFVYLFPLVELEHAIVRYVKQPTPHFIHALLTSKLMAIVLGCNFVIGVFNQLTIFQKYSISFYVIGWTITLYPVILALWYFRCHWTQPADLKLTFFEMDLRKSTHIELQTRE